MFSYQAIHNMLNILSLRLVRSLIRARDNAILPAISITHLYLEHIYYSSKRIYATPMVLLSARC